MTQRDCDTRPLKTLWFI